jgi:hypothetical protein
MQSRATAHLAKILRQRHAENQSWETTAQECKVLKADGSPDKGLAFLIAMRGYEPARKETRQRLGLGKHVTPRPKPINELPVDVLRWMLEHRVEM